MDLYDVNSGLMATEAQDLELAAMIVPLPKAIKPSAHFMKQTRELLLSLNQRTIRAA